MVNDIAVQDFVNAIKEQPTDNNTTYNATVSRIDSEGVVWVNLYGSDKETPTASTSAEVHSGDAVTVNWRNNKLYIGGNYTNPSAGVGSVNRVAGIANNAQAVAEVAYTAANSAVNDAERARVAAESAEADASSAAQSAASAQQSASSAGENASRAQAASEAAQLAALATITTDTLHYLATNQGSGVTKNTPGWTTTVQSMTETNKYLWTYHTYTSASGSTTDTTPVITGVYGQTGGDGVSITAVQPQYYLSQSDSSATGGSWSNSMTYVVGKFIWTRDMITYSDGTTTWSEPSTAVYNEALTQSCKDAAEALGLIEEQQEYFWHDALGAHVLSDKDTVTGTRYRTDIKGAGLEIFELDGQNDISVAKFGSETTIGQPTGASHIVIDFNSFRQYDKNGNLPYVWFQDLRGADGYATIYDDTLNLMGDSQGVVWGGIASIDVLIELLVDGVDRTADATLRDGRVVIAVSVADVGEMKATYKTSDRDIKAYTLGFRNSYVSNKIGAMSYSEGLYNEASGYVSHAEGYWTTSSNSSSHAEGHHTTASGNASHAEGNYTTASGSASHAEGFDTEASGWRSHSSGEGTIANCASQMVIGEYNEADGGQDSHLRGNYAFIIGNGADDDNRSNALTVEWNGNVDAKGDINIASGKHYKINGTNLSATDVGALPASSVADYVTSKGTSGNWSYEKYASGKVEAFFYGQLTGSTPTQTSTYYYRSSGNSFSIPSGIFPATPTCVGTNIDSSNTVMFGLSITMTSATAGTWQVFRTNANAVSFSAGAHFVYTPSNY